MFNDPPALNEYNIGIYTSNSWGKLASAVLSHNKAYEKYINFINKTYESQNLPFYFKTEVVDSGIYRRKIALRLLSRKKKFGRTLSRTSTVFKTPPINMIPQEVKEKLGIFQNLKTSRVEKSSLTPSSQISQAHSRKVGNFAEMMSRQMTSLKAEPGVHRKPTFGNSAGKLTKSCPNS